MKQEKKGLTVTDWFFYPAVIMLLLYLAVISPYSANEFYRPFLYLTLPLSFVGGLLFYLVHFFDKEKYPKKVFAGILAGTGISYIALMSNYIVKEPVDLKYIVTKEAAWGKQVTWDLNVEGEGKVPVIVEGVSLGEDYDKFRLKLNRGLLGYYYGQVERINP